MDGFRPATLLGKAVIADGRYVNCMGCGYIVTGLANNAMVCDLSCPECGLARQFGPTAYVADFKGKTLQEAARYRIHQQRSVTLDTSEAKND